MSDKRETPLQAAKRRKEPYVMLVMDERHLANGRGKITVKGPVSVDLLSEAKKLFTMIVESKP